MKKASSSKTTRQLSLLTSKFSLSYGGELLKKRKGRQVGRPLSTRNTIHLVLRSSLATGSWSFKRPSHEADIRHIIQKFARMHFVQILSLANVGNHLHLQIKLDKMHTYKKFIRAITSAIAMKITGLSRWQTKRQIGLKKFWDYRPFTRIVQSFAARLTLQDYIAINQLEGLGYKRDEARFLIQYVHSG